MTTHHSTELDTDSVTSSPKRGGQDETNLPRVRFMCSFGGKILPRPHDNQLRYVGGDTRIVAIHRHSTFSSLLIKLSKLSGSTNISIKYQLPNEDLDALITVTTDEDVENMLEEYERVAQNHTPYSAPAPASARLRLFLFPNDADSRASSISSLLDGSAKREHWFLDALNGGAGPGLERGRSEASSIVSEVPDYLFGLDNPDDTFTKLKTRLNDNVSVSDPGSPAPVVSSPFCSATSIPELHPVKTKPEIVAEECEPTIQQQARFVGNGSPMWHYGPPGSNYPGPGVQNVPFYYVPGSGPHENVPIRAQYVHAYPGPPGQMPYGIHRAVSDVSQLYGRDVRPIINQQMYYGVRNAGAGAGAGAVPVPVPVYSGLVGPDGEEMQGTRTEAATGRVSWAS